MEEYNVNGEPAKRRDCVKRDQPDKINVVAAFVSTDTKTKLEISTLTNVSSVILLTCWEQRVSINVAKWRNRPQTFNRLTEQMFSSSFIFFFISRDDCSVTYFISLSLLICIFLSAIIISEWVFLHERVSYIIKFVSMNLYNSSVPNQDFCCVKLYQKCNHNW